MVMRFVYLSVSTHILIPSPYLLLTLYVMHHV